MNGNSTLERRYSFNMGQVNPAAESTHLNGSGFAWGTSISPKHRSNSSFYLNNTHTTDEGNNRSIIVSPKSKNISKIDARIVADIQSKGLASRIVKYHESGTRLNRSMSAHNLYSKPGQFPVVTLKKTELPYRATKQELSMIRIPPPEKSSFYGNTISSLLRSSSVVGLQSKRTEDLSRENRPIIHPPPTEDDMAPTRSVLDVLKEISRKRINSDDLEADETTKKYCNRGNSDFVDTGSNCTSNFTTVSSLSLGIQRYKRQRDCITPHQSVQITETKTSPEQAKKRVCNYNNDITSSLSSSVKCKPYGSAKRTSVSHNFNQTMPTNLESYEIQKSKIQRYLNNHDNDKNNTRVDMRFENLENNLRKTTTVTQDQQHDGGVPPKRTVSEPIYSSDQQHAMNSKQSVIKPRLTLFNKKCNDDEITVTKESSENIVENTNDFRDFDDCAGIPFVKPKKISSISGLRNPVIERTQKSKLALMLSGLRGELYQNSDVDELDSTNEKPNTTKNIEINKTTTSAATSSLTSQTTTLTDVTSCSNVAPTPITSISLNLCTNTKTTTLSTVSLNASTNKTSSPLVGLKLSQPSSENITSTTTINTTKCTETLSKTNAPSLVGFTFGLTSSSAVLNTKTENSGLKDSKTPIMNTSSLSSTTNNNVLNFGSSTQLNDNSSRDINQQNSNLQSSGKDNSLQLPSVGTAFRSLTNSTNVSSNSTNTLKTTNAFTFGPNGTAQTISSTNPITGHSIVNSASKLNNSFNFTVPSTSITTPSFSTTTSDKITSSTATATTSASTFDAGSAPISSSTSISLLTFSAPKPTTVVSATNQSATISSSVGGKTSSPFTFGSNTTPTSMATFGTNAADGINTQETCTTFPFNSDTKTQYSSIVDQNKSTPVKQTETTVFSFGSPSLKASSATGPSPSIFGNNSNSLSNATPLFGSTSIKTSASTFGSSAENKSSAMASTSIFGAGGINTSASSTSTFGTSVESKSSAVTTPSVFGAGSSKNSSPAFGSNTDNKSTAMTTSSVFGSVSNNSNTSTPFSFGSEPAIKNLTNTNNNNNNNNNNNINSSGGFSFGSVAPSTPGSGPFSFGISTSGTTNTPNNTFGSASSSATTNKNFTFGSSASKSNNPTNVFGGAVSNPTENVASPGGFSFGSAMSPKTGTFSFGTGGNSFSGSNVSNTNTSSSGFSFGGVAASKPNEPSSSKSFSFGSTQPSQQQQLQQQQLGTNNNGNSTNIFGSRTTTNTVPPPAFSFNSGNSTNMQSNVPIATNNIFAPPNITTGPGDRIIRRATRRLQK